MVVMTTDAGDESSVRDPLLPWLLSIKMALDKKSYGEDVTKMISECISTFKHNAQYRNDPRFLKIWLLYLEVSNESESVFREMEEIKICSNNALLYELYASFLEAKEHWHEANRVYGIGILRKAEPLERLKNAQALFLKRMSHRVNACSLRKAGDNASVELGKHAVHPWSASTIEELTQKIKPDIKKYDGYHSSNKAYSGKVALSSLRSSRNKIVEIGKKKYQIMGCAGQGGFAQVFKAYDNGDPDNVVALKIQNPAFPWEFYMYRLLDQRISGKQRSSFGYAHRLHLYSDYSVLVCDYLSHGTLHDVINSYVVKNKPMEEVLCIYYTMEMLYMLESLHGVGLIHGDFKPDNMLIRYARTELTADDLTEDRFLDRSGPWGDQGLCLVDWGRGIDLHLFPDDVEFDGDCRTSGFRCIEMQERRPWKFEVDTYGLCVIVHLMLHNNFMEIQKKETSDGSYVYLPRAPFRRYWNVDLWKNLFTRLLNGSSGTNNETLQSLRKCFQDYLCCNPEHLKKLKDLLVKQRLSLCSA